MSLKVYSSPYLSSQKELPLKKADTWTSWAWEKIQNIWRAFISLLCCQKEQKKTISLSLPQKNPIKLEENKPLILSKKPPVQKKENPKPLQHLLPIKPNVKVSPLLVQVPSPKKKEISLPPISKPEANPKPFFSLPLPQASSPKKKNNTSEPTPGACPCVPQAPSPKKIEIASKPKQEICPCQPQAQDLPQSSQKIEKQDAKEKNPAALSLETPLIQVFPVYTEDRRGFLKGLIRGEKNDSYPAFVEPILQGNAHELLNELPTSIKDMKIWGKGELAHLAECPCPSLSRIRNPTIRREFEETVVNYCASTIPTTPNFHIAHIASGHLFGSFVLIVRLIKELSIQGWKGKIHWSFIDIAYGLPVIHRLKDDSLHTASILSFCKLVSKILPEGIELECNFFPSFDEYQISVSDLQELSSPDCIIGIDLGNAETVWEKRGMVGGPNTMEALLDKRKDFDPKTGIISHPQITFRRIRTGRFSYSPQGEEST